MQYWPVSNIVTANTEETQTCKSQRHTIEIYASTVAFKPFYTYDLDLWPSKLLRQCPLTRQIFVPSFIQIPHHAQ